MTRETLIRLALGPECRTPVSDDEMRAISAEFDRWWQMVCAERLRVPFAAAVLERRHLFAAHAAQMQEVLDKYRQRRARYEREWLELAAADRAACRVIKGWSLDAVYRPMLRSYWDVDVVVDSARSMWGVCASLLAAGYDFLKAPSIRLTPDRDLLLELELHREVDGLAQEWELHVGGFTISAYSSLPVRRTGADSWTIGLAGLSRPEEHLLVLAAELYSRPELIVRDWIDAALLLKRGGDSVEWERLESAAGEFGLLDLLRLALLGAEEVNRHLTDPVPVPGRMLGAPRRGWAVDARQRWRHMQAWSRRQRPERRLRWLARNVYHDIERWFFDHDLALEQVHLASSLRDPINHLQSGGMAFLVPLALRPGVPADVARCLDDGTAAALGSPASETLCSRFEGRPLVVTPIGVFLVSVDCLVPPGALEEAGRLVTAALTERKGR